MSKNDDQQSLISFRLDEALTKKFEALKERFASDGKKTSTSQVARAMLQTSSLQHGEFGELYANQREEIKRIQELTRLRQPLRRAQWELLSFLIHRAYQSNRRQMVQSRYLKATLQSFAAWRRFAGDQDDRYFLSNLRDTGSDDLLQRVDDLVSTMPTLVWNSQAEFGARNFNVAMRDGIDRLHIVDLNDAFLPYVADLLPVAVRAVYMHTGKPLREVERDVMSLPIRSIETEHYWLNIIVSGEVLTAGLDLSTHRSLHPLNSFLQFMEFAQLLDEVSPENPSTESETYSITGPVLNLTSYYVRYRGHQMEFTPEEFEELRELFRTAFRQEDVQRAIAKMIAIYGDI